MFSSYATVNACVLTVPIEIHQRLHLTSDHEKADTRIISHSLHAAQKMAPDVDVVMRSPDSDAIILLLYYSFQIHQRLVMDTGVGSHRRVEHALELGQDVFEILLALHAFTGCDCTSSLVHKGKRVPFEAHKSVSHWCILHSWSSQQPHHWRHVICTETVGLRNA